MDSDDDGLSASQALEYERLGSPDKAYYGKDPAVMRRLQEERRVAEAGRQGSASDSDSTWLTERIRNLHIYSSSLSSFTYMAVEG